MINEIKKSQARSLLPQRIANSHKGENGKVLIIGGSVEYYGAPLLAAMGALRGGADLVYLYVPECNFEVSRNFSPDLIVRKFEGDYFNPNYAQAQEIVEFARGMDCVLIGPGIGKNNDDVVDGVFELLNDLPTPTVLDSTAIYALKKVKKFPLSQPIVITPHGNEFKYFVDRDVDVREDDPKSTVLLRSIAMDLGITVLLKGAVDLVCSWEGVMEKNLTGNAGMTVGGSGDVLAGLVSGLMAQGLDGYEASKCAAYFTGAAGDLLKKEMGNGFIASDIYETLPLVMK